MSDTNGTVAVLGGGVSVVALAELLAASSHPPRTLRLAARRLPRLRVIAQHADRVVRDRGMRVEAAPSIEAAVDGADAVIIMVRVGGFDARAHDEAFPVPLGHVGDEGIGLGGASNAWRTAPFMASLAETLRARCPDATILNMVAPLGLTSRVLHQAGLHTIGVCELPAVTQDAWGPNASRLAYAGLNHLGWFWANDAAGRRALTVAQQRGDLDLNVFERFEAAPLHYFYRVFDPEAGRRLGIVVRPGRARTLETLSDAVVQRMAEEPGASIPGLRERSTPWFDHALVPALVALNGGPSFAGSANLPNQGRIPGVADEVFTEVFGRWDRHGFHPDTPPAPPKAVQHFLTAVGEAEDLLFAACTSRDPHALGQALDALPLRLSAHQRDAAVTAITA